VKLAVVLMATAVMSAAGCSSSSLAPDAAIACGWNEPDSPIVSALEADDQQLAENAQRATSRLEAARRVAEADGRFGALVEALQETADFAVELTTMSRPQIASIPNSRWDFAKYTQAAARDQCEQLAAVVEAQ
jgi:hypothetical protein